MTPQEQINRKTVAAIVSVDNDYYTFSQVLQRRQLLIWNDLGLGPDSRRFCGRILNRYIKSKGKKPLEKLDEFIKASDSVQDIIDKVTASINA